MLTLKEVTKTFNPGTPDQKRVLSGISFHLSKGDFVTLIGSNGAGKSTLLGAICGSFPIDGGTIELGGRDITAEKAHARARYIGRLFQDPLRGTAPAMSVMENLYLASGWGGWLSTPRKREVDALKDKLALLDMGLENRLQEPVGLLSGGQRQALTLLMATITPPKLLLLDEHTAALDPAAAKKVLSLTASIVAEHGLTCLMVTHNMKDALRLGNRTMMMDGGSIVLDVSGAERKALTVDDLLQRFKAGTATDRVLLS